MSWNRPQLKRGVDLQLQTAFDQSQWASVIRLAEKRFRTFNDFYYEIVKICAASQLDSPVEKYSAVTALQKFVKDGTIIKDVDGLDLLEWAVGDLQDERAFPDTFGPLKVRLVKANSKDRNAGVRCLESCLLHWDLVSAQQIAAIMDRAYPQDRTFFFWNIVITYLLCSSDQCSPDKKKLYGMLAVKQMQRAAQSPAQANGGNLERAIRNEEEILLLYRILETHGSDEEWSAALEHPTFGPVQQFRSGRKDLFLRVLDISARRADWQIIFSLCKACLTKPDSDGQINLLACDWGVWRHFLAAASHLRDTTPSVVSEVIALLTSFSSFKDLRPIYLRNILLARVAAAFELDAGSHQEPPSQGNLSSKLDELQHYIESQCSSPACFDDVRNFAEQLTPGEMKSLAYDFVPQLAQRQQNPLRTSTVKTLAYQLQYLVLTVPGLVVPQPNSSSGTQTRWDCAISGAKSDSASCPERFRHVAESAVALYHALTDSLGTDGKHDPDCVPDLAIVTATSLIRLSGLGEGRGGGLASALPTVKLDRLLQAAFILDYQLTRSPKHSGVTFLLARLYLALGCVSRAKELWDTMDVKRTIIDSLGPFFFDRLSTLSPTTVVPSPSRPDKSLMYPLKSYYRHSLKLKMPRRLADAFEAESLTSILEIPRFIERLRTSCTMVMGHVEEARAARALGTQSLPVSQEELLNQITDNSQLAEAIDYGPVPRLDATSATPIFTILQIGPGPSNSRTHLSLVAEKYFELLMFKPSNSLKATDVSRAAATDDMLVTESLQQLNSSANKFLRVADQALTSQERTFYDLISLLTAFIALVASSTPSDDSDDVLSQAAESIDSALDDLTLSSLSLPPESDATVVPLMGSLHGLSYLRDASAAIRLATAYLTAYNESQKTRDRTGQTCFSKNILAHIRKLDTGATKVMKDGKAHVAMLKKELSTGVLNNRIEGWTFGDSSEDQLTQNVKSVAGEEFGRWASLVADSWRTNIRGWEVVKWE